MGLPSPYPRTKTRPNGIRLKVDKPMIRYQTLAAALLAALLAWLPASAQAKPVKVCFKTANGKNYISRGSPGGYLHAEATKCSGHAVFVLHDVKGKKKKPRFGKPVVMMAEKMKRYVWLSGKKKRAFATRAKYKARDRRFVFQFKPTSGAGKGAPMTAGVRVAMLSYVKGQSFYAAKGGGKDLAVGDAPRGKSRWAAFTVVKARR